jgi:hypothetical protein
VAQGAVQVPVKLSGTNFESGATVTSHAGIKISATFASSTELDLLVTVSSTEALGSYNLFVFNPDGGEGECAGCLAVTAS